MRTPLPSARPSVRAFRRRLAAGIAALAAANLVPLGLAEAQVAAKMNEFFNDAGGAANVTGPSAYQGQTAGYYSGGNVWTRFPQKSVQPFNLQLPSARAGCGGIDLFSGSFSFINSAELVAMMKGVANNALGFAFKLAISSISPQISKEIDFLQGAAQQLNQMNISSCEAAQGLVGAVWPKMQGARSTICAAVGNSQGKFSDWAKARQGCGAGGEQDATLEGNSDPKMADHIPAQPRNYTWEALKRSNKFGGFDPRFSEYLMTLVGTVVISGKDADRKIHYFGPGEDAVVTALLDGTQAGKRVKILSCVSDEKDCLDVEDRDLEVPTSMALRPRVKAMIVSMNGKIRTDSALDNAEKQLLNMTNIPLYKMLTVQALAHSSFNDGEIDVLAEIVAVNLLTSMIDNMIDRIVTQVGFQPADQATAETWRGQLADARNKYAMRDVKVKDAVLMATNLINRSVMLESTLQNTMSPGMAAALNFSRGLSSQGLN